MTLTPVLIAGAGPTGLNLALSLARRGVACRLIDENAGPGEHSRAMGMHARTLEFYSQYGFADEVVADGIVIDNVHVRKATDHGTPEAAVFRLQDFGDGISPYPFMLAYPQDDHERFLVGKLEAAGVHVERNAKLTAFLHDSTSVRATITHGDGRTEETEAQYLCGCDGARSKVREVLGVGFGGGTYPQNFFVADVKVARPFDRDLYVTIGQHMMLLMFPVRTNGMQRLLGLVPPELTDHKALTFEDLRATAERQLDMKVTSVNWFSVYHAHHRVADRFRVGRAFILGDAGHIHSPAGGQGMNTGIGDAINLGWKLAHVIQGRANAALLDTYEPERIGFARTLVKTTDSAFAPMVSDGLVGEFARFMAPLVAGVVTRFGVTRHAAFRAISQTHIHYPKSALSEGEAGSVHGGDRLPWVAGAAGYVDNFAALRSLDWQAHVYGAPERALTQVCFTLGLPVHVFDWSDGAAAAGLQRDAIYLVRPDSYVAWAGSGTQVPGLEAHVRKHGLRFAAAGR